MTRVMLTGATGFIGRQTAMALLTTGHEVFGISRRPDRLPLGVHGMRADLLDRMDAMRAMIREARAEILIHTAWTTEHGRYWTAPDNLDWSARTLDLTRAFIDAGGRRIVTVGTCAEYDWSVLEAAPCREDSTAVRPHTLYGVAKHATAEIVTSFCQSTGADHAHARLFMLFGEGEQQGRLVPSVIRALLAGQMTQTTSGRQTRDFMDARDAGSALASLALSGVGGPVNVATGRGVAVRDVVETLGSILGRADLVAFGALPDRPDDPPFLVAAVERLTHEVGFRPRIDLNRGLHDAIAFWRTQSGFNGR